MENKSLKELLAIILTLGNYMNGGNMSRGQADGFGLEILSKLKDIKSTDSQVTLLHFIIRTYMKKIENPFEPNVEMPVPEPYDIGRAASINFDEVKKDLNGLQKKINGKQFNSHYFKIHNNKNKFFQFAKNGLKKLSMNQHQKICNHLKKR